MVSTDTELRRAGPTPRVQSFSNSGLPSGTCKGPVAWRPEAQDRSVGTEVPSWGWAGRTRARLFLAWK
jgi:hypothetical protein